MMLGNPQKWQVPLGSQLGIGLRLRNVIAEIKEILEFINGGRQLSGFWKPTMINSNASVRFLGCRVDSWFEVVYLMQKPWI
jgi:hypothetical protein